MELRDGIYDLLIDGEVEEFLRTAAYSESIDVKDGQLDAYLSSRTRELVHSKLSGLGSTEEKLRFLNELADAFNLGTNFPTAKVLRALVRGVTSNKDAVAVKPEIPVGELALLTNAKGEPAMGSEIRAELFSADRVDLLIAFIRVSGLRAFYEPLRDLKKRNVPVRVITSAYLGATEKKAVDQLVNDLGAEVRIDYLARANRLHAKAWLIHRESGYSTAYVGSSNISDPALSSGLEWNVRLSQTRAPEILDKFRAAFDSYWNSDDFADYLPGQDDAKLEEALQRGRGNLDATSSLTLSGLDVRALPHQEQMLEELQAERDYNDIHRNLVVAATGSGKTVLAALDFKRFASAVKPFPSLLFVAHREEILTQSRKTFAEVMKDASFGELMVNGAKPKGWLHVFASIQSLQNMDLADFARTKFDYIVIDEFHHAAATSYRKIIDYFEPKELLGLTATPERTDGVRVQDAFFGGRIATELRLWDALDQELLTPFHYFGIGEATDFTSVGWSAGAYKQKELSNLVTGNQVRDRLMFDELNRKVPDLAKMKALFFCVDVEHAKYVAELLNKHGVAAECVVGETATADRQSHIKNFRNGTLSALTSVDVFNEGFDVPEINTVVMLRPTESPLLFLQQLGRGLRKAPNKPDVLVLDFIGAHRAEYRIDLKFATMLGRGRTDLKREVEAGFPYLPSGVVISLDEMARNKVLQNIKDQVNPGRKSQVIEVRALQPKSLLEYMNGAGRELWEVFGKGGGWLSLKAAAEADETYKDDYQQSKVPNFFHINDPQRLKSYLRFLEPGLESWDSVDDMERRTRNMFFWHLWPDVKDAEGNRWESVDQAIKSLQAVPQFCEELRQVIQYLADTNRNLIHQVQFKTTRLPLFAHANYSRYELIGAIGRAVLAASPIELSKDRREPKSIGFTVEGVFHMEELELDMCLVTLNKGDSFTSSTRYNDYAETPNIFHWESQSGTTISSPAGQRYLNQAANGNDVAFAIREKVSGVLVAETFKFLGLANFIRSEGEKPIKIWWRLQTPLDPQTFKLAAAVRVA